MMIHVVRYFNSVCSLDFVSLMYVNIIKLFNILFYVFLCWYEKKEKKNISGDGKLADYAANDIEDISCVLMYY